MANRFVERGGWWLIVQGMLLIAALVVGMVFHHQWQSMISVAFGWLLIALGAFLGIAGWIALGRNMTAYPRPPARSELVRQGIYGRVRHPLYSSLIHLAFGWALIRQSWPALAVAVLLTLFLDAKARYEERWLLRQFPEYAGYSERVRRFVPLIY
jgi:protein-S-isoprenylcysteine O-methyltransferase Ste14